ncbi:MAG: hypothetical protein AAF449_00710 [Myxococcota bacterium]
MSTTPHAPTQRRYGTDAVDFTSKYTSNIKDAYRNDERWAVQIIEAERTPIVQAKALNPRGLGKNNLYGAMHVGLRISSKSSSPDPTVRDTLGQWARNLNSDFAAMKSYAPDQLEQRAVDLRAVIQSLTDALNELSTTAEIGNEDIATWRKIVEGLESYADGVDALRRVLAEGPGIEVIHLDVDPKKH